MSGTTRYFVGAESGRAATGPRVAVAAIEGVGPDTKVRLVRSEDLQYEDALRQRVLSAIMGEPLPAGQWAALGRDVGGAFAGAIATVLSKSRLPRAKTIAVGNAGQTMGVGMHIGSAATIAERTGLPIVSDFAAADIAAGGRGGPLSAWPDWVLLHDEKKSRVLVDLGAIATVTFLPADGIPDDTVAFEAGPGTTVLDAVTRRHFDRPFDADGALAAAGSINGTLLNELLADPYLRSPAPKVADNGHWSGPYLHRLDQMTAKHGVAPADLPATVAEMTVRAIVAAIDQLPENPHEVLLAGGGSRNIHLAMRLRRLLTPASTVGVERFDLDGPAKTALDAAVLAAARIDGIAGNVPATTGGKRAVLGSVAYGRR